MVYVSHDHDHRAPGLKLLSGIHMVVNDFLFNGDGDFPLHLAAQLRGHEFGGVEVDGFVDGGHDAVFHQGFDHLGGGLLHAAGQLCHHNFLGNFYGERRLFNDLHAQAAHFLLLLGAGLAALEFSTLFVVFGLAADFLLAAGDILDPLGDQSVHPVVEPVRVDLHGGGIHHTALPLALRLHGLGLRLGLGLDFRLGCGGGGLDCRAGFHRGGGFGRFLGRLGLRLFGGGKNLLQRVDLTVLGDMVKDDVQLLVGEYLAVALGLVEILAGDF